jgi:hypothetical protein
MKITGILITPSQEGTKPRIYDLEVSSYRDYYPLLECDTFDIQTRKFGDKWLDIYCDDEGRLKGENNPSILTYNSTGHLVEEIVGNVFIVGHNEEGETISLNEEEINEVMKTMVVVTRSRDKKDFKVCIARI